MKRFLLHLTRFLKRRDIQAASSDAKISFVGSWRLILLVDSQGQKQSPRWKEVWSFAAMNEDEINGIYACDYINLHTIIGKWELRNSRLKLVHKECESEYLVVELSSERLILKPDIEESKEMLIFQRVV